MKTGEHKNEHGVLVSEHVCDTCSEPFTVCPGVKNDGWENCMAPGCPSFDPNRDVDHLFGGLPHDGPVVSLDAYRPHRSLEVICVKCAERWVVAAPAETPLREYECRTCGTGHVIATGQW